MTTISLVLNSLDKGAQTRNLSEASPFFCHFSHSFKACFQLPEAMASWIGRTRRSVTAVSAIVKECSASADVNEIKAPVVGTLYAFAQHDRRVASKHKHVSLLRPNKSDDPVL